MSVRKYTCIIAYRAECCDETHIHHRVIPAKDARIAAVAARLMLTDDIPSAEVAADEVIVISGDPEIVGFNTEGLS